MSEVLQTETEQCYRPRDIDIREVPISLINSCSQYRRGNNPIQQTLDRSVTRIDLINPLTTGLLEPEMTSAYIEFTNMVRHTDISLEDFRPFVNRDDRNDDDNGKYLLLVAGHSRLKSLYAAANKQGIKPENYHTWVNVRHDADSVDGILQLQIQENIHSNPSPQNTAQVLAESFLWMKETGEKISRKRFAQSHCVSDSVMADAINYVNLPANIRELTDAGLLPYKVAAEMGRAVPVIAKYAGHLGIKGAETEQLQQIELGILAMAYRKHGQVLKAVKEIKAQVEAIRYVMDPQTGIQEELVGFKEMVEETPVQRSKRHLENLLRYMRQSHRIEAAELHNAIAKYCQAADLAVDPEQLSEMWHVGQVLFDENVLVSA